MRYKSFLFILLSLLITSCGGTESTSTTSSSDTSSGSSGTSSDSTGTSGTTDSGTSSSEGTSSSALTVSGQFSSLKVSALNLKEVSSSTITHVYAVSPATGDTSCKIEEVKSDGSFQLDLKKGRAWMLGFLDKTRTGSMFLGMFRSSGLRSIWANKVGKMDLGTVTISSEVASASTSHTNLLDSMDISSTLADEFAGMDQTIERYANPDVDNDGTPDCSQSGAQYMLDFHVRFDMKQNGSSIAISDIINNYPSETSTTATYTGTGIYLAYPTSFSSSHDRSVRFVDSNVTTSEGGSITANTETTAVTTNNFGDFYSFGPNATSTSELPSGQIDFKVGDKTLRFTHVKTPALSELTAPVGRVFPFIQFKTTDSTCTADCTLGSLSYKWMEKTADGWKATSLTKLALIASDQGATLSIRFGSDSNSDKTISFTIPITALEGSITWDSSKATLSGVTASELTSMVTTQICHLGLSYDDKLGMRYFEGIQNTHGTCQ